MEMEPQCEMEPQSTMVIPVLDELVLMDLPVCWRGVPGGGGWSITEKLFNYYN